MAHPACVVRQNGMTVLMWAASNGRADVAQLLLEHDADMNLVDKASATSASFAEHLDGVV